MSTNRKRAHLLAALSAMALLVTPTGATPAVSNHSAVVAAAKLSEQIDPLFAAFQREKQIPGLVYGIVANGKLIQVRGFGVQELSTKRPVQTNSLFRIASMTKAFTALSVLSLRDAGKLSLDAPVETYVPELRGWRYPTADSPRIRVRDLLHHTAGFVSDDPWGDRQTPMPEGGFTKFLQGGVPFTRPPGIEMEYSNFGYALLGRVISNVSGLPYREYVEEKLLRPLGMLSSGFEVEVQPSERRALGYRWEKGRWILEPTMRHGAFGAMGGLQTNADDYALYVAWLLSAWPPRDDPEPGPVRRSTVRELIQGSNFAEPRQRIVEGRPCPQTVSYGMGMRVFTDCELGLALSHGGGFPGYGSGVLLLPDEDIGLFVFSNRTYAGGSDVLWQAASVLNKMGLMPGRPRAVSPELSEAYTAARQMYRAGDVLAARQKLAGNFLLDRSAHNWRQELATIKKAVGECDADSPMYPRGALSSNFRWLCERGTVNGFLLLAPTKPVTIQELRLSVTPPPPGR